MNNGHKGYFEAAEENIGWRQKKSYEDGMRAWEKGREDRQERAANGEDMRVDQRTDDEISEQYARDMGWQG